jgi:cytoskeletal protein CcmA (bactofilin family)
MNFIVQVRTGRTSCRIEGKIIGNVNVENGVILGEKGNVEGDIHTKSAIIFGTIQGSVKSSQLEIKKTGIINGDISTDTLEIELGAQYNGKLNMRRQPAASETGTVPGKPAEDPAQIPDEAKKAS